MKFLIIFITFLLRYQMESSTFRLLQHPLDVMCKLDNSIVNYTTAAVPDIFLYLVLYHSLLEDIQQILESKQHDIFHVYTVLRTTRRPLFAQIKLNVSLCENTLKWTKKDISNIGYWLRLNRKKWLEINEFVNKQHKNITCEIDQVLQDYNVTITNQQTRKSINVNEKTATSQKHKG